MEVDLEKHAELCSVCRLGPEAVEQINVRYMEGELQNALAKEFEVSAFSMSRHFKAYGMQERKLARAEELIEKLAIGYLAQLATKGTLSDRVGVKLVEMHAKIKGLLVERVLDMTKEFEGRTEQELEFYSQKGRWPLGDEKILVQDSTGQEMTQ